MHDRWRKTNEKSDGEKKNVPFNVRPGSEVPFELGQVGHGELLFRVEAADLARSKFGIWFNIWVA